MFALFLGVRDSSKCSPSIDFILFCRGSAIVRGEKSKIMHTGLLLGGGGKASSGAVRALGTLNWFMVCVCREASVK